MAVGDALPALLAFTLAEAYFLQRTVFAEETFRRVCLGALGVNLTLKALWTVVIWPFVFNPLRHLPTIPVSTAVTYLGVCRWLKLIPRRVS